MSNKNDMLDALRYTICTIQGGLNKSHMGVSMIGDSDDEDFGTYNLPKGTNGLPSIPFFTPEEIEEMVKSFTPTFNPNFKLPDNTGKFSREVKSLNNISDHEVDRARAKFGKGFHLEKKCSHNMNKKWLLTSFYLKCDKCGYEEG